VVLVVDASEVQARHDRAEARVAELMGVINAATSELVDVIGDVVESGVWETAAGIKSAEHWVTWQCGVSHARAESWVRMGRRRRELPESTALFRSAQLSEDSMAAIARRAPAARDHEVAGLVPKMLFSQVDKLLRTMPRRDEPELEPEQDRVTFGSDGVRWKLHANIPADLGAVVEKAMTAARSQVFHERHPDAEVENRSEVSWVDGLVRAAELALQHVDGGGSERRPADRYQVWMHLDASDGSARWHLGSLLPDTMRRYLLCDCDLRAVIESDGMLSALSSRIRTVDDKMRAFVEDRDGGCRVPGCEQRRWLQIHHLWHWEDGGPTVSWNLCALCPMHHRLHHAGRLRIEGTPNTRDGLRFYDHKGREIAARAGPPRTGPLPPAAAPYVHPPGEAVDWHWVEWKALDDPEPNPN